MEQSTTSSNEKVPTYCEHYEPLLVEEIALAVHPTSVHYGKCALIGYLREQSDCLESVMVPSLPKDMQLPDSTCSVPLCFDNYRGLVPRNVTVRVYGAIHLQGPAGSSLNSSGALTCSLNDLKRDLERRQVSDVDSARILHDERVSMGNSYKPVLAVHGCERVDQARELIGCNLRLKRINKRLAPRLAGIEGGI